LPKIASESFVDVIRKTVMECLKNRKTSYQINELDTLIDVLRNQPEQTILSLAEHQYFGHITIDIIDASEGSISLCKIRLPCSDKLSDVGE
jgi:hypothetical protein